MFVNQTGDDSRLDLSCAEVLDRDGEPIKGLTLSDCTTIATDSTIQQVLWKGGNDLSAVAGRPVRFRFQLRQGRLYSFWVSSDRSGASHGYVAAGGPGFTGPVDTVGKAAYKN